MDEDVSGTQTVCWCSPWKLINVTVLHVTVIVNYARQMNPSGGKSVSSSVASAAIAQAQWSMVRSIMYLT